MPLLVLVGLSGHVSLIILFLALLNLVNSNKDGPLLNFKCHLIVTSLPMHEFCAKFTVFKIFYLSVLNTSMS